MFVATQQFISTMILLLLLFKYFAQPIVFKVVAHTINFSAFLMATSLVLHITLEKAIAILTFA